MFKPYKIIEETATSITYQYNSLYSWCLLSMLLLLIVGLVMNWFWLQSFSIFLFALYFLLKLVHGMEATRQLRAAFKNDTVEIKGNKYSLRNPLTLKIPKHEQ